MSQHYYETSFKDQPITILMGWDRPLQGFFMVIETIEADHVIYSNLSDYELIESCCLPDSLDHFLAKLKALNLSVPEKIIQEIKNDGANNVGNRYVYYNQDGSVRSDSRPSLQVCHA